MRKELRQELFGEELKTLQTALERLRRGEHRETPLFGDYQELALGYQKLLRVTSKIFMISDSQGKELKRREIEFRNILDHASQGFLTFGPDLAVNREFSAECARIFGGKVAGRNILELLAGGDAKHQEQFGAAFAAAFREAEPRLGQQRLEQLPSTLRIKDGFIHLKYKFLRRDGEDAPDRIMLILTDITERRKVEDRILFYSFHDNLTSLYNRAYVDSILPELLREAALPLSLIMADLNGLKLVNDVWGHAQGDRLLVAFADLLRRCCRRTDIVSRWGGDEFLVLLPATDAADCARLCDRIGRLCHRAALEPIGLSVALGTATLVTPDESISERFAQAETMMYEHKLASRGRVKRSVITGCVKFLQQHCLEDAGHLDRVKRLALAFAGLLPYDAKTLDRKQLALLATLHDVGKVAVPETILGRSAALTEAEWRIIRNYPKVGFRMANAIGEPAVAQAILAMRERWDGQGYPYGLKQEQIPLGARLVAIVDAFDVITHGRPNREALPLARAVAELQNGAGSQFDPELVVAFLECLDLLLASLEPPQ
jgi:diguanylate cyclase (GGDEF)-like protein